MILAFFGRLRAVVVMYGSSLWLWAMTGVSQTFPLWLEGAPGQLGHEEKDTPTLTVYMPEESKATGAAMVVFPGGAYWVLSQPEGEGYARWLAENGITSFVVKYRLGSSGYRHPAMLQDAARAFRIVRARAAEWKIDPDRIGVIGSSAGGHLATTLLTHFDSGNPGATDLIERVSSRPTLGVLCYPVVTMGKDGHAGSRTSLLGEHPDPELVELLSNEKQVTPDTPPCFIMHRWEDTSVKVENSLAFAAALRANSVKFELHVYEKGGHGMGLNGTPGNYHRWTSDCLAWLKERGFAR